MTLSPSPVRPSPDAPAAVAVPGLVEAEARRRVGAGVGLGATLKQGLQYVPGIVLLFLVGYAGKLVTPLIPHTEYVIWAIAIGMLIRNTIPLPKVFLPGIATYELWLKAGIVLMGVRFALSSILSLGAVGIALVVVEIACAMVVANWLAKRFKLSDKLGSLIGVGNGICGVSAIIGAAGAIEAKQEEATYAIATILLFGAAMIFLYPVIGHYVGMSDTQFGFWAGLAVDNTAECVAAGFAYSEGAGKVATLVKLCRNALMGLVILYLAVSYARRGMTGEVKNKGKFLWDRFPKFVLGFLALSVVVSLGLLAKPQISAIAGMSKWLFLLTFAGVGLSTEFSRLKAGITPFVIGLVSEVIISVVALAMIFLFIT
ncbi:MAG: putative sulfate exporter family transporter [Bacillota bacterium]|nr:MAG: putative sulfate exporter family transporter [Bacillota bacterium]